MRVFRPRWASPSGFIVRCPAWLLACLPILLIQGGCSLPPPAEETALSDPLARPAENSQDPAANGSVGQGESAVRGEELLAAGEAWVDGAATDSPIGVSPEHPTVGESALDEEPVETSVLVVDEASGNELQLVESPGETIATGEEARPIGALDRAPELVPAKGDNMELTERDLSETLSTGDGEVAPRTSDPEDALAGGEGEGLEALPDASGAAEVRERSAADWLKERSKERAKKRKEERAAAAAETPGEVASTEEPTVVPPDEPPVVIFERGEGRRYARATFITEDLLPMTFEVGGQIPDAAGRLPQAATGEPGAGMPAAVILIHGLAGNRSQWREQMDKLFADTTVVSMDLLGHGDSPAASRQEWTIPRFGRDVAGLIERLDLRNVIVVGHAMGGQVALEVAVRLPERVTGVIGVESLQRLSASQDGTDGKKSDEYIEPFQEDFKAEYRAFIEKAAHTETADEIKSEILEDALQCDKEVAVKLMRHFQTRDLSKVARSIECPVFCINSDLFVTEIAENQALLPGFGAEILPGVGFWPHLELPESFHTELALRLKSMVRPVVERAPPTLTGLVPVLFCDDVAELEAFYVQGLQFAQVNRVPDDVAEAPTLVLLERDGFFLSLQSRATVPGDLPNLGDVPEGGQTLFLRVTDLAQENQRLGPDAIRPFERIALESGSARMSVMDPVGNVIILEQPPRRRAPVGPGQE